MICSLIFLMEKANAMEKNSGPAIIRLPEPVEDGSVSVEQALKTGVRQEPFQKGRLPCRILLSWLWAAQGTTSRRGFRTAPSAGALYPLEIYVASGNVEKLPPGLYHYRSESHDLEIVARGDHRMSIYEAALNQGGIKNAPALFLFSGVFPRTLDKYGRRGIAVCTYGNRPCSPESSSAGGGHGIGAFADRCV
jgi:hypothetical protein